MEALGEQGHSLAGFGKLRPCSDLLALLHPDQARELSTFGSDLASKHLCLLDLVAPTDTLMFEVQPGIGFNRLWERQSFDRHTARPARSDCGFPAPLEVTFPSIPHLFTQPPVHSSKPTLPWRAPRGLPRTTRAWASIPLRSVSPLLARHVIS